ncbi:MULTISPECIES: efflux RND transporter periplasmic adaptor subunit [Idiomarina]|uniref:efflux RND transporter periplasmic adaptor subunit n=1 Tax=Idiomarina TaxID=135575 RepID=UPI00129A9899|nr:MULTISPECIES: efflux RND transporter periplasmic adaptor subunit [Idiomarina]MRJ40747.1 efflux RND transporter periplasmic adaptor subunit [Idiomarina sp. FeN1]NCU56551.1 efflux RND transporter periplasmic adaptor subunit [Idiomarina sp. FenA--70]NCU58931.1 efflux RND transporter periplasmic adaptor subunit [Idiomarina sp. FenBw--71]UUN14569.1 efflux RND transporter periplasmic adaptor subunit [Idiomarina loihiensis]
MQQRLRVPLLVSMLSASLALAGCGDAEQAQGPGAQQQQQMTVGVVTIAPQNVDLTTTLPGRASAYRVAEVRPQVNGILQRQLFQEGAMVEAGQQLYQIDAAMYEATLASAEAELKRAQATLKASKARFERSQGLVADKAISQQDYDEAEAAYLQAEAQLKVAEASITQAKLNLEYTRVKAPISGRIGRSQLTEGALLSVGQAQALTTIHQLDPIYIDIAQSSSEYLQLQQAMRSGQIVTDANNRAAVTVKVGDNTELQGELLFNEVTVDPQTSAITLRAKVANPEQVLMPGMYVRTEIASGELQQAILAPQTGVTRDPRGRAIAMVVNQAGEVEQRYLTVQGTVGSDWIVTDGLTAGDQVIVEGLQKIQPGMPVKTEEVK